MADSQRIDDLRRRVQADPASIAFAQLAEECRRAGHYQESVDVCRAGLELHPGYLSARVTLGRALIELNDLTTALAELEHVLKSAPENLAAIRGVAEIHHRQGALAEALSQYRAALALARNDPDLQRTVDELARQVEPPPPPASADGLSFEQLQDEFLQNLTPPPAAPSPAPITLVPDRAPMVPEPEPMSAAAIDPIPVGAPLPEPGGRDDALRLIAVLERWLDAIHVVRAQPRA
jgi:tetratricopeptide (TPR) repeat protein